MIPLATVVTIVGLAVAVSKLIPELKRFGEWVVTARVRRDAQDADTIIKMRDKGLHEDLAALMGDRHPHLNNHPSLRAPDSSPPLPAPPPEPEQPP